MEISNIPPAKLQQVSSVHKQLKSVTKGRKSDVHSGKHASVQMFNKLNEQIIYLSFYCILNEVPTFLELYKILPNFE